MKEYQYINEDLDINLGDIFIHKADERRMVVYDFEFKSNDLTQTKKDKSKPICKFFLESTNTYDKRTFAFHELTKLEK